MPPAAKLEECERLGTVGRAAAGKWPGGQVELVRFLATDTEMAFFFFPFHFFLEKLGVDLTQAGHALRSCPRHPLELRANMLDLPKGKPVG